MSTDVLFRLFVLLCETRFKKVMCDRIRSSAYHFRRSYIHDNEIRCDGHSRIGTPGSMRKRLAEYEDAGVQELILWFPDAAKLESLRLFAREFIQS